MDAAGGIRNPVHSRDTESPPPPIAVCSSVNVGCTRSVYLVIRAEVEQRQSFCRIVLQVLDKRVFYRPSITTTSLRHDVVEGEYSVTAAARSLCCSHTQKCHSEIKL